MRIGERRYFKITYAKKGNLMSALEIGNTEKFRLRLRTFGIIKRLEKLPAGERREDMDAVLI